MGLPYTTFRSTPSARNGPADVVSRRGPRGTGRLYEGLERPKTTQEGLPAMRMRAGTSHATQRSIGATPFSRDPRAHLDVLKSVPRFEPYNIRQRDTIQVAPHFPGRQC